MVSSQEKIKIRFLLRRIGFLSILGAKPNAMKKTLQLLAAVAALLLPAVSCEDLFRPDKPAGPPEIYYTVPEACDHAGEEDVWVQGYIVGAATGSKKIVFGGPYAKNTNLVLAPWEAKKAAVWRFARAWSKRPPKAQATAMSR